MLQSTCKTQHSYIMSGGCEPGVVPSYNVSIWKIEYKPDILVVTRQTLGGGGRLLGAWGLSGKLD